MKLVRSVIKSNWSEPWEPLSWVESTNVSVHQVRNHQRQVSSQRQVKAGKEIVKWTATALIVWWPSYICSQEISLVVFYRRKFKEMKCFRRHNTFPGSSQKLPSSQEATKVTCSRKSLSSCQTKEKLLDQEGLFKSSPSTSVQGSSTSRHQFSFSAPTY